MADTNIVGKTLGGFEILEKVGQGGMGAVYRARQISLDRIVALKILAPHLAENEEFVGRFIREAQSIAKVNHTNILQVYEAGHHEGMHYIAMEFIDGETLSDKLSDKGFLDWRICIDYIYQAALALASAAKVNIIHRDIKPDNLMITAEDVVKVSDFGLAKEVTNELTQTGDLIGTPAYMSPEQCDGLQLDTRTDIYSLGASFYRAVTGVLPFNAPTPMAMMYKHKHEPLIPPRKYMPTLPEGLEVVIMRMMEKDRDKRYATDEEVADALDNVMRLAAETNDLDRTMQLNDQAEGASGPRRRTSRIIDRPPTSVGGSAAEEMSFEELVETGNRLMREQRPVAAADCWRRALQLKPDDAELRKRVDSIREDTTVACLKLGNELLEHGRLAQVRAELHNTLSHDPDNIDAREKLAALEFMEQRKRRSILEIRQLLSSNNHERAMEVWENLHPALRDKTLAETMRHVKEKIIPCKRLAEQAEHLSKQGFFEESLEKWAEALALDPENDKVKLGQRETERYMERMEGLLRTGYEYMVQRQYDAAVGCFDQVLSIRKDHQKAQTYIIDTLTEKASTSESKHDLEAAQKAWQALLERDPENAGAAERLAVVDKKLAEVNNLVESGRDALSRHRFAKAIRHWRKALTIQPTNKAAQFGIAEAKRQRVRRRFIPAVLLVIGMVAGWGFFLRWSYQGARKAGDEALSSATRIADFAEAIRHYNSAGSIPIFGYLNRDALQLQIRKAKLERALAEEMLMYESGQIEAHDEALKALLAMVESNKDLLDSKKMHGAEFLAHWRHAELLVMAGKYEEAEQIYRIADSLAGKAGGGTQIPDDRLGRREAVRLYMEARLAMDDVSVEAQRRHKKAILLLESALKNWQEFKVARDLLTRLQATLHSEEKILQEAQKLLKTGRTQIAAGAFDKALTFLDKAHEKADEILKNSPAHWEARKIQAEAAWRKQAGPDMVFFLYPVTNDPQMRQTFKAFALDRYEWPNKKGELPQTVSFAEARSLALGAKKVLPRRDEWQHAASGKEERVYAYGNTYDPTKGNTEGRNFKALPSGSNAQARTPEGLFDVTGNLAEWVLEPVRGVNDPEQLTAGGHFGSNRDECMNTRFIAKRAAIRHANVGFRAALRWSITNE